MVFCHKDGIPSYAGEAHRLSVLRGMGWLNDEMRKPDMTVIEISTPRMIQQSKSIDQDELLDFTLR